MRRERRSLPPGSGGSKPRRGFSPELVRKGEARVVDEGALFAANSAPGSHLAQLSCMKFVGFAGFYQSMVPDFAEHTAIMTDLLAKDKEFIWTNRHSHHFDKLKEIFASTKALSIYDPKKELHIETDASDRAIGAVARQDHGPIDYYCRKLSPAEVNYSTGDKEMLGIVAALKHWRQYTQGAIHQTKITLIIKLCYRF